VANKKLQSLQKKKIILNRKVKDIFAFFTFLEIFWKKEDLQKQDFRHNNT